jgi:hypothetical protein
LTERRREAELPSGSLERRVVTDVWTHASVHADAPVYACTGCISALLLGRRPHGNTGNDANSSCKEGDNFLNISFLSFSLHGMFCASRFVTCKYIF